MSAIIIDGKAIAQSVREEAAAKCAELKERGIAPTLAVIIAGEDPASQVYVRNKARACKACGIRSKVVRLPEDVTQEALIAEIDRINADDSIHALLVQHPIPAHLDEPAAFQRILARKDADGFHYNNLGALMAGAPKALPCTPAGCMELLRRSGVPLEGANAVVIGRSNIVGKPMAMLLLQANCTVTVCHSRTKNLKEIARGADILICALGKANFVTADMVKPGAAVIDVGINRMADGTLRGDCDFEAVSEVAGWITPVPGGVGPMTIAMLMKTTVSAAEAYGA